MNRDLKSRRIANALRCAAGLPVEDDPFVHRSDETDLPNLSLVVSLIIVAAHGPGVFGKKPRNVEGNLEGIRRKLQRLRQQIADLDDEIRSAIDRAGSAEHEALKILEATRSLDLDAILAASRALVDVPNEKWTVPAALAAMERLENALVPVIERAINASEKLPDTGRPPGGAKGMVALIVARYLQDATDNAPQVPDEPWHDSTDPFSVALAEIFDALDLPPGTQRPIEYATAKL